MSDLERLAERELLAERLTGRDRLARRERLAELVELEQDAELERLAELVSERTAALLAQRATERPLLVGAGEAAALLGVPESWVRAESRADRLPHVRLGKYYRYDPAELARWAGARRRGPEAPR